jgi:hypothetical protein
MHNSAAGVEDLRVYFGENTADVATEKLKFLKFSPLPENYRKADTQNARSSGDLRH